MYDAAAARPKTVEAKCERVRELWELNEPQMQERWRVREIMNNRNAFVALVGSKIKDKSLRMPVANMMLRADTVLGQKLGREPDSKVDPPAENDSDAARNRADKRARTVRWLDSDPKDGRVRAQLPQVGRWLPGYGFVAGVVKQGMGKSGQPMPVIGLRDPIQTLPGAWGTAQQPPDMAVCNIIDRDLLCRMFPDHATTLKDRAYSRGLGGAVLLGQASPGWANQHGSGVEVYEYHDEQGCWYIVPEHQLLLTWTPNVVKDGVQFRIVKRYSFDELCGQYDPAIGPLANMAWLALLATIAVEDGTLAETNIFGDLKGDEYRRGRKAVNHFTPGSSVERGSTRVPFETFTQSDRIERQLRILMGHTPQDDGEQQGGWATGRGLEQLGSSGTGEVREYQNSIADWLCDLDAVRLEFLDRAYPDREFTINGQHQGARFSEKMIPSRDIKGDYVTRREYGAMAAFDDAQAIVAGTALLQAEVIDTDTMRENMSGLGDHERIKDRIRAEKAEKVAFDTMLAMAQQGEPKAMAAAIQMLPSGDMRQILEGVFLAEAEEPAMALPEPQAPPPDVTTVMSRLTPNGASGGVQTVGRV